MLQRALVIGYGSIGARHARILSELGCRTAVVSRRQIDFPAAYANLQEALDKEQPEYVIIASETSRHHETLLTLAKHGYTETVLVEKPLFGKSEAIPPLPFSQVFVAYNLRFHPLIRRLKSLLAGERIVSVQAYVGQYLPDWRPNSDYRTSYSASAEQGGGVLRDLSHELDYLAWLLGKWQRVSALGGHLSDLEISSDDVYALMWVTPSCPVVTLQLNYLDRTTHRNILINTTEHTIEADIVKGTITIDKGCESITVGRDDTYRAMHDAILSGGTNILCTMDEGLETLKLIEAAEQATCRGEWVKR